MKNFQGHKFGGFDLSGSSSSYSKGTVSEEDKISTATSYDLSEQAAFYSNARSSYNNVSSLTVQKIGVADSQSIFSVESSLSSSYSNNVSISKSNHSSYNENSYIDNYSSDYSLNKFKSPIYKNPSSYFSCSKCGLGFPCSVFVCKRVDLPENIKCQKHESQSNHKILSINNLLESPLSEDSASCIVHSSEDTSALTYLEAYNLFPSEENVDDLLTQPFSKKYKRHFSSSKEYPSKENKMQCKTDSNELNADIKLPKTIKNVSGIGDTHTFNSLQLESPNVASVKNSLETHAVNFSSAKSPKMHVQSLSQGTRNFLNELASNATNKFSDNVSGYALSSINSPFSSLKTKKISETNTNDNHKEESISNDESNTLCNIASDNKDVTNALDLIEQSSLHDRNLSSAEICSSLNQIFSEANSDLSANIVSNIESDQTEEISAEYETITVSMNNDSEILFQTVDSNVNLSADTETGTINLADLCAGNDPEILQRILLVHDESGNIETVYLLPEDTQINENTSSAELNEILALSESNDINITQLDQGIVVNNDLMENSAPVQDVLIAEDVTNTENALVMEDLTGKDESTPVTHSEDFPSQTNTLQNNLNADHGLFEIENPSELKSKSTECSGNYEETTLVQIETKNGVGPAKEITTDNLDKDKILSANQAADSLKTIQEPLIECERKSVTSDITKQFEDDTQLSEINNSVSVHLNENSGVLESNLTTVPLASKAKKSCRREISEIEKTTVLTPVNGSIYHSNSNHTLPNKVQCYSSNLNSEQLIKRKLLFDTSHQKSKKSLRSAKKSFTRLEINNSSLNCSEPNLLDTDNLSHSNSVFNDIIQNVEDYITIRNMILKRGKDDEDIIESLRKRSKNTHLNNKKSDDFNGIFNSNIRSVALKTFKKPFTAAKKSFESGEILRNVRNTSSRIVVPKSHKIQVALKSFAHKQFTEEPKQAVSRDNLLRRGINESNINTTQSQQNNPKSDLYIQPEVCEIQILSNDYVKRASQLLLKASTIEPGSTPEENFSDEEMKLSSVCNSPLKELLQLKSKCSCTAKEVPCLCNEENLQLTCEAEDTFDEKVICCENQVSQQYLLTPSSEVKNRAFCDMHLWRLRQHHCCPKCGIFCSQGEFLLCSKVELEVNENHLFHTYCSIVPSPGLPPGCPHCCKILSFTSVHLIHKSSADQGESEVPLNAENITRELNSCDIFLTVKKESSGSKVVSKVFVPEKDEIQLMITSLAKEKSLRLRPTGKCLYNPIKTGDVQKVMQLIGNGVNPNHKFRVHGNNAPLHVAAHYGWTGILHILLQAGALIDTVNDDLETPLIVAVEKNQLPIVRYLVLAGAQIDVKDCNGMTSFHIASKNGFKEIAEFLYSTGRIDINLQDDGGWTALVWACEHKHLEFVKWVLEIGSDPNVRDNEENTVLHWAAYSGKSEIAELLLEKGSTLSYVNKRGDSPLHIAAREDNYECVKFFISRGAVVDQKNKENKTPLMCCEDDSLSFNYLCQAISSGALKIGKMQLEKHVVFRDISRGAEAYPIQAINEVDEEEFIMEFRYVVKQCLTPGVNINSLVDSMQFCFCKDNCVTRDCNCTINSKCWYDTNGCLTNEYDLLSLPAIYECNKTCHCPKTCINRVVQQGLRFPLQIFRTQYQGWGVRSLNDIPKGAFVCEYVGEVITGSVATERNDDTYFFDLESQTFDYCLDGRYYGNVARFLNHSCEPNLVALKVFVDHQDLNFPRIAFFAFKDIQAFEELCFDYGLDFWLVKCQSLLCTCRTQSCKYSKDSIDDTLYKFFMDTKNGAPLDSAS